MERPAGSNDMPPGMEEVKQPSFTEVPQPKEAPKAETKPTPAPEPVPEPMEVDDEDAQAKKAADELKVQGNAAYKGRKFEEAIPLYEKAWETYPKDITYLVNLSGEWRRNVIQRIRRNTDIHSCLL
jgi:stress-induced-phosphoprotein 1